MLATDWGGYHGSTAGYSGHTQKNIRPVAKFGVPTVHSNPAGHSMCGIEGARKSACSLPVLTFLGDRRWDRTY